MWKTSLMNASPWDAAFLGRTIKSVVCVSVPPYNIGKLSMKDVGESHHPFRGSGALKQRGDVATYLGSPQL